MAQTPEGKTKAKVQAILKAAGIYFFSPMTYGMGRSGVPDIIACVNGCFLAIECKAGKGKTTALQDAEIANIRASGGVALVIYETNLNDLRKAIHLLMARPFLDSSSTPLFESDFDERPKTHPPKRIACS